MQYDCYYEIKFGGAFTEFRHCRDTGTRKKLTRSKDGEKDEVVYALVAYRTTGFFPWTKKTKSEWVRLDALTYFTELYYEKEEEEEEVKNA